MKFLNFLSSYVWSMWLNVYLIDLSPNGDFHLKNTNKLETKIVKKRGI